MTNTHRICKCCKTKNPLNLTFYPSAGIINNIQYYRALCIKCYGLQKKQERNKNKLKFENYKKTLSCSHCGNDNFKVLEFHHVDAALKERNISDMLMRNCGWNTIMKELKKCICLCANCHRIIHYVEKS